jgi:PAS domain S-box-containing protein
MQPEESAPDSLQQEVRRLRARVAALEDAEARCRRAENALAEAEQLTRMGVWDKDLATGLSVWSDECYRLFGQAPGSGPVTLEKFLSLIHPDDRATVRKNMERAIRECGHCNCEFRVIHPDGTVRVVHGQGRVISDAAGRPVRMVGAAQDVTERRRLEDELRAGGERYRTLFEGNPQPMFVFDRQTLAYLAVNDAAVVHYGYSRDEILGMTVKDIRPPEDVPALLATLARTGDEYAQHGIWRHRKKDGTVIEVEVATHGVRFGDRPACLTVAHDVTERRRLEAQLRQAQKMEAVGRLAGGVAHDFNNLLTVVNGYSDLLLESLPPSDPIRAQVEEISRAARRATDLTSQLLAFGRKAMAIPRVLDLNALVRDTEKMLRRLIGEDVELVTQLDPALGRVKMDPGQLDQVILNLAVNARDAMPQGGTLTIETRNVELSPAYVRKYLDVVPGPYVALVVRDTGHGMTEEVKAHVFEPFFTTKEVGKGTGLGLSTIYGIVKQAGGHIEVESAPGRGATFRVLLPRLGDGAAATEGARSDAGLPHDSETVLLVEDEDMVRTFARVVLQRCGYTVLEATNGPDALHQAEDHHGPIHLLASDVVMPHMSGRELAERLSGLRPQVRVLFFTGYMDDAVLRLGILKDGTACLQKPFSPDVLARKVREVLDW